MSGSDASAASAPPDVLALPPGADLVTMAVAICAVSTSGPLMAATAAPALAIAFWRNAMSATVLLPWALVRNRAELARLPRGERRLAGVAGLLLAAHFATWVPSLRYTSVASATALVSTQPIWAALLAHRAGARISARAWIGIVVAVGGAAVITGVDVGASVRSLAGDALAVAGGACAAGYMVAGSAVRRHLSTAAYTAVCYSTTALVLLVVCAAGRQSLAGYSFEAWSKLVLLTLGAQFLGHSLFNRVLRNASPTVVSLAILFEVPGAALIAALWLHQTPRAGAVPGLALLVTGVGVVIAARDRRAALSVPVE